MGHSPPCLPAAAFTLGAELPDPPALVHWTVEQPIPLAVGLAVAGAVFFVILNQRNQARRAVASLAAALAAGLGVLAAGYLIQTTREFLEDRTRSLVESVFARDIASVESTLSNDLVLASAGEVATVAPQGGTDRDGVLQIVKGLPEFEWDQRPRGAALDGPDLGRTRVTVRVKGTATFQSLLPSTWELSWRRDKDGQWTVRRIECITILGRAPGADWAGRARQFRVPLSPREDSSNDLRPVNY